MNVYNPPVARPGAAVNRDDSEIRKNLHSALNAITTTGTFAAFTKIHRTDIKPIFVINAGFIEFPLPETTARALIAKSRPARTGTPVDASVCNSWELDAAQLHLSSQWNDVSDSACRWVANQLGIPPQTPIKAELYKMLIHEKGAIVKAHTHTERIPGKFGTMIVCLPSEHRGGDLVLKHRNSTKAFKTSGAHASMACWFSDVSYQALPMTSGLRLVLSYNLTTPETLDSPRLSAMLNAPPARLVAQVGRALRSWLDSRIKPNATALGQCAGEADRLYYVLDHNYTEANLSLSRLKGDDLSRIQCLKDVCESLDATLFLGILEREDTGECEDIYFNWDGCRPHYAYYDENCDNDFSDDDDNSNWHQFINTIESHLWIRTLVSTAGTTLQKFMDIPMNDMTEKVIYPHEHYDPWADAGSEEENYSGFTGNKGVTATHWYWMAVAIVVPNDVAHIFLTTKMTPLEALDLLPHYLAMCSNSDPELSALVKPTMSDLCKYLLQWSKPYTKSPESTMKMISRLAEVAWSTDQLQLETGDDPFKRDVAIQFMRVVLQNHQYETFCQTVGWFEKLEAQLGTQAFAAVRNVMQDDESLDFSQIKNCLLNILSRGAVRDTIQRLNELRVLGDAPAANSQILEWFLGEIIPAIPAFATEKNGEIVSKVLYKVGDCAYLRTKLLPLLRKHVSRTPFILVAVIGIIQLADRKKDGLFPPTETANICKPLLKSIIDHIKLPKLRTRAGLNATPAPKTTRDPNIGERGNAPGGAICDRESSRQDGSSAIICPSSLVELLAVCSRFQWDTLMTEFSTKVVDEIATIPLAELRYLWIPFLNMVINTPERANVPFSTPSFQQLSFAILKTRLDRYVGAEPSPVADYSNQGPVPCSCNCCKVLNQFLASGGRVFRFEARGEVREHIEGKLNPSLGVVKETVAGAPGMESTLVLTKTIDAKLAANMKASWTKRLDLMKGLLEKFDQVNLKQVLGESNWKTITEMDYLKYKGPPTVSSNETVTSPTPSRVNNSVSADDSFRRPLKRKAEDQIP